MIHSVDIEVTHRCFCRNMPPLHSTQELITIKRVAHRRQYVYIVHRPDKPARRTQSVRFATAGPSTRRLE